MNYALISGINLIFQVFSIIILVDVIASWIVVLNVRLPDVLYRVLEVVHNIAGIVLNPIRKLMPSMGGLDLSPFIALLLIEVLRRLLIGALLG